MSRSTDLAGEGALCRLEQLWAHPVMVGSVALLILNDQIFKTTFSGQWWTGKLSDVAGMTFFPALVWTVLFWTLARRHPDRGAPLQWASSLATACAFAAIQTIPIAGALYSLGLGTLQFPAQVVWATLQGAAPPALMSVAHTPDVTDLWALFAVLWLPLCFGKRESQSTRAAVRAPRPIPIQLR